MKNKVLNSKIHLELYAGLYYKPYNENGDEIKGILLKDCTSLYNDRNTWEMITLEDDGSLHVGPFNWDGYNTDNIGDDNFVLKYIEHLNK